ncbi:MAG: transketolase [Bacteroidetes bacterium]|nr:transketolase [Bacteroidota bacterium]MBK8876628.1 transketolase [Bacteroidota bacterium]
MSATNTGDQTAKQEISFDDFRAIVLNDYRIANESRQASLLGRREVLTGKAKFGIFGDGKEIAQLAMAKAFRNGDFRSGYYRDQTFMMASGLLTIQEFFAQLYAHPDVNADPSSAGRLMNGHYATRLLDETGNWKNLTSLKNSSADISPTAGQMPRLLGLALASKLYRSNQALHTDKHRRFSNEGNEVAFGTIGDASTSEGLFFETINAAGVLQVPMAISVWDDGYGISVPKKFQTTKASISDALRGFEKTDDKDGYLIFTGNGWDYPGLVELYEKGIAKCREQHIPVLFHIQDLTQPQGHSTSGSHERYKSKERLKWEEDFDCIKKMREWMLETAIATPGELDGIEAEAKKTANDARKRAWDAFRKSIQEELNAAIAAISAVADSSSNAVFIHKIKDELLAKNDSERKDIAFAIKSTLRYVRGENNPSRTALINWLVQWDEQNTERYDSHLMSQSAHNAMAIMPVEPQYNSDSPMVDGREILLANFEKLMAKYPEIIAFGEDVGHIGGVNQTWAGLQEKFGMNRVMDTGIREATIIGQGIGMALRGLRPIAEIQYLDYLVYALTVITDDLACLQYRTRGGQKAPLIISTRGHRLEGVWHSGSPIGMLLGSLRGMYLFVPRNMTQAAGFYNTMLASDDAALIIEPLNGYRSKERLPVNIGEYKLAPGIPEVLREGDDITIVTYGSCCKIVLEAAKQLEQFDISCEVIDVQTLLPFDVNHMIVDSLRKTNKILFMDEDVPGGGTAYMLQKVMEEQGGFDFLEIPPVTLAAKEHRPAYGSDGDYYSKPNTEDVFDTVYEMIRRCNPGLYPPVY